MNPKWVTDNVYEEFSKNVQDYYGDVHQLESLWQIGSSYSAVCVTMLPMSKTMY